MLVGCGLWLFVVTGCTPPKKLKTTSQKEEKKNNLMALEIILDGLLGSIKANVGQFILAK